MDQFCKKVDMSATSQQVLTYDEPKNGYLGLIHYNLENERIEQELGEEEGVLVVLTGECGVEVNGKEFTAARSDLFTEGAEAVYIPARAFYTIEAEALEAVLFTSPCQKEQEPFLIGKEDLDINLSGREQWRRTVRMIQKPDGDTFNLIVGETLNEPGKWSGFPPHRHDRSSEQESELREIYFYKINPDTPGFGLQLVYGDDGREQIYKVHGNESIFFPGGYHPFIATPGAEICYIWALAGPEKDLRVTLDAEFADLE